MNISDFTKRIDQILKSHDLSASVFADRIGVQRSSVSHLLTGRNKPSLEFVLKIIASFPEVDLYWLLYGQGTFPKKTKKAPPTDPITTKALENKILPDIKTIDKIIIFYSDGSFTAYAEK